MQAPLLLHFMVSHYSEKVRWALDYKRIPHHRRAMLPGPHARGAQRLTGKTILPILVLDGRAINDSTDIINALEQRNPQNPELSLYPRDLAERRRALELEDFFDEELGPHVRRVILYQSLPFTDYLSSLNDAQAQPWLRRFYRFMLPLKKGQALQKLQLYPEEAERSRVKIIAAMDRLEQEIGSGGYLVGDRFSVADLTAASMLYLLATPPEFPYYPRMPRPAPVAEEIRRYEQRPAIAWVRGMYQRHRGVSAEIVPAHGRDDGRPAALRTKMT